MSSQEQDWSSLGRKLGEYQDENGDWAKNYQKMRTSLAIDPSNESTSFSVLSLVLGSLLLLSVWGNAYQFGLAGESQVPPCPAVEEPEQQEELLTSLPASGTAKMLAESPATVQGNESRPTIARVEKTIDNERLTRGQEPGVVFAGALPSDRTERRAAETPPRSREISEAAPLPLQELPGVFTSGKDQDEKGNIAQETSVRKMAVQGAEYKEGSGEKIETLPVLLHAQLKVALKQSPQLLPAYRIGDIDQLARKPKRKLFDFVGTDNPLSFDAGLRVSGGFPYQAVVGPSLATHVRVAYKIASDSDGSPIGVELGFFQGRPNWLNENNILYRSEQPATTILDNFPEGVMVEYEVYDTWGIEIGASEFSQLTDWLGIRTRLGLSILSHKQQFRTQDPTGEPIDFSSVPGLVQPFGMYWNIGPEIRFAKHGHLRLSYHGLIGNNARKAYFPGRNNGLEGVEVGLGWGF